MSRLHILLLSLNLANALAIQDSHSPLPQLPLIEISILCLCGQGSRGAIEVTPSINQNGQLKWVKTFVLIASSSFVYENYTKIISYLALVALPLSNSINIQYERGLEANP